MATKRNTETEANLRDAFRTMNGDDYQTIREAYYKAVEGLRSLADALEQAAGSDEADPLLAEHVVACEALTAMDRSQLGRIL
ncbi:MAG: hypothetical protein JNM43_01040 [Planctomycetaceae bacterium]|jgi:hypothetical protein|nr:hypothetical protein [Planctomycetaceae bacterium]